MDSSALATCLEKSATIQAAKFRIADILINTYGYNDNIREIEAVARILGVFLIAEEAGSALTARLEPLVHKSRQTETLARHLLLAINSILENDPVDKAAFFEVQTSVAESFYAQQPPLLPEACLVIIAIGMLVVTLPWTIEALGFRGPEWRGRVGNLDGTFASWWKAHFLCGEAETLLPFINELGIPRSVSNMNSAALVRIFKGSLCVSPLQAKCDSFNYLLREYVCSDNPKEIEIAARIFSTFLLAETSNGLLVRLRSLVSNTGRTETLARHILLAFKNTLDFAPSEQPQTGAFSEVRISVDAIYNGQEPLLLLPGVKSTIIAIGMLVVVIPWAVDALGFRKTEYMDGNQIPRYLHSFVGFLMLIDIIGSFAAWWKATFLKGEAETLLPFITKLEMEWGEKEARNYSSGY